MFPSEPIFASAPDVFTSVSRPVFETLYSARGVLYVLLPSGLGITVALLGLEKGPGWVLPVEIRAVLTAVPDAPLPGVFAAVLLAVPDAPLPGMLTGVLPEPCC